MTKKQKPADNKSGGEKEQKAEVDNGPHSEIFDEIRAISDWACEMRLASWQVSGICEMQHKSEEEKVSKNELLQHLNALEHGHIGG